MCQTLLGLANCSHSVDGCCGRQRPRYDWALGDLGPSEQGAWLASACGLSRSWGRDCGSSVRLSGTRSIASGQCFQKGCTCCASLFNDLCFGLHSTKLVCGYHLNTHKPSFTLPTLKQNTSNNISSVPMSAKFGLVIIFIYLVVAIFAPLIAPYGEREILGRAYELMSSEHLLGTDNLGRDMLSRLIYGARNTIGIALITTALAFFVGSLAGMIAAALGGWIDQLLSRIVDVFMSIPSLIFALLVLSIVGTAMPYLIGTIVIIDATRVFRVARATAMNVAAMDYVEVARLRGEKLTWVLRKEILPNITAPLLAEFGLRFCFVFLFISALSFLGLGIQPPTADWGSMVRDNATLISYNDITPLIPAAAIALLTVAVNFVVDWMLHKSSGLKDVN